MKVRLSFVTVLFCLSINCSSQDSLKNTLFLELFGNGIYYSVNYERQFSHQFVARGGLSFYHNTIVVPLTFGKFFGKKKNHFELTAGVDFRSYYDTFELARENEILITGFVGYRLQNLAKFFLFRIGLTPFIYIYDIEGELSTDILISGGLSVGYRF